MAALFPLVRVARFNKGTQYLGLESFLPTKSMMEDATVEKVKHLDYFVDRLVAHVKDEKTGGRA